MTNFTKISALVAILMIPGVTFAQVPAQNKLSRQMEYGSRGEDVKLLQEFLATDKGIYPEGIVSGYFGSLTQKAILAFQAKHNIDKAGRVGPKTLSQLNELLASNSSRAEQSISAPTINISAPETKPSAIKPITEEPKNTVLQTESDPNEERVIIRFKTKPGKEEQTLLERNGVKTKRTHDLFPVVSAKMSKNSILNLKQDSRIQSIEPDIKVRLVGEIDNTWGVAKIKADVVQASGNSGQGVKVAVVDTGIDCTHPEIRCAGGYNFVNDSSDAKDDHGHGTHVAGTIGAAKDGVGVVGASPEIALYSLKVLDASGSGYVSDIIAAMEWAIKNGIQVANHSYGSVQDPGQIFGDIFRQAESAGMINIAAAGNSGSCAGSEDSVNFPAKYTSVIAVGALTNGDSRPCFSSTGPAVELAAPGVIINSTRLNGGYVEYSGTSMAAPHASGVAALLVSANPADTNGNGKINDEVRSYLQRSAVDLGIFGRDTWYGYGLIKADSAIALIPVNSTSTTTSTPPTKPEDEKKDTGNGNPALGNPANKNLPVLPPQARGLRR